MRNYKGTIFVVYMATNKINGCRYVGASSKGLARRKAYHIYDALRGCTACRIFYRALRKYGAKNFKWRVIGKATTRIELMNLEIAMIAKYKPEYNITRGGDGIIGLPRTKAWYAKVSKALKGRKPSPQCIEASRLAQRGRSIICLTDGKFFRSIKKAAKYYNLVGKGIGEVLYNRQTFCGGLSFIYATKTLSKKECTRILKEKVEARNSRKAAVIDNYIKKPTICLTDGKIYESGCAAAKAYSIAAHLVAASRAQNKPVSRFGLEFRDV